MTLRYKWYSLRYHWGDRKKFDREVKAIKHDYKSNYTRQKMLTLIREKKNDAKYSILSDSQLHNRI